MKLLRVVAVAMALTILGSQVAVAAQRDGESRAVTTSAQVTPAEGCFETDLGYRCFAGPFDVPANEALEVNRVVDAPPQAGFLTSLRATLVDAKGDRVAHHMVHLHHGVWINPNKTDTTCDSFGNLPNFDRFFATGKERTRVTFPEGHGYYWDNKGNQYSQDPFWFLTAHLDGMHGSSDVYVRLDIRFTPAETPGALIDIDPIWLDVMNCENNPVFDVAKGSGRNGRYRQKWTYTMPVGGNFVTMGGHLHDGGKKLVLRNETTGAPMFTSDAIYGMRNEPWYLTKMTSFSGLPGIPVAQGDVVKLTAVYDSTHNWHDAMGIMVGALVPAQ